MNSAASMTRHRQLEAWAGCSRRLSLLKHRGAAKAIARTITCNKQNITLQAGRELKVWCDRVEKERDVERSLSLSVPVLQE